MSFSGTDPRIYLKPSTSHLKPTPCYTINMTTKLQLGISGIRGIWGDSLTAENAEQLVRLCIQVTRAKTVVLGSDTRASRDELKEAVIVGLRKSGCSIIDCGIIPTPTLALMVRKESADVGIMMTASHNPAQYNGLKFFSAQGLFLAPHIMQEIFDLFEYKKFDYPEDKTEESMLTVLDSASRTHVFNVLDHIDTDIIKKADMRIVVDAGNGAGFPIDQVLFNELGIDVTYIHESMDGLFERNPEPLPEFLDTLGSTVCEHNAAIGFAQDPDADRLAIVDEKGVAIGEEYTLALAMRYYLQKNPEAHGKLVVANLSTSKLFDDVAEEFGCKILRTKIGEINVASAIVEENAVFGGEGSGGVIWPEIGYVRDSIAGMALILEYLASSGKTISELVDELPRYVIVKDKVEVGSRDDIDALLQKVRDTFSDSPIDITDGVKVNFNTGWLHVRPSNTEPIVRIFAEALTIEEAERWISQIIDC